MKFLVIYKAPVAGLEAWMQQDASVREVEETAMKAKWDTWMAANGASIVETAGAGKTKLVTAAGVTDIKNDIMLYSLVEAESHEAAAKIFEGHPHFGIPEGTIEVMVANTLPGMQ